MAVIAPVFDICRGSSAVLNTFGSDETRIYPFGYVDKSVEYPYAVWQNISGEPSNYLAGLPDMDGHDVQFDVYADDLVVLQSAVNVLRDALEKMGYITRWGSQDQDIDSKLWHIQFDYSIFSKRG